MNSVNCNQLLEAAYSLTEFRRRILNYRSKDATREVGPSGRKELKSESPTSRTRSRNVCLSVVCLQSGGAVAVQIHHTGSCLASDFKSCDFKNGGILPYTTNYTLVSSGVPTLHPPCYALFTRLRCSFGRMKMAALQLS